MPMWPCTAGVARSCFGTNLASTTTSTMTRSRTLIHPRVFMNCFPAARQASRDAPLEMHAAMPSFSRVAKRTSRRRGTACEWTGRVRAPEGKTGR